MVAPNDWLARFPMRAGRTAVPGPAAESAVEMAVAMISAWRARPGTAGCAA